MALLLFNATGGRAAEIGSELDDAKVFRRSSGLSGEGLSQPVKSSSLFQRALSKSEA